MSSSGHCGFTWLHRVISPSAAGSHIVLSCSLVTSVAKSFCLLTTTEMPSKATGISMNSTPFSSHTGTSSATSIGLEASEIWVSPLQNASKPSLVPEPPMLILASGFSSRNSSAAACVIGRPVRGPPKATSPATRPPPHRRAAAPDPRLRILLQEQLRRGLRYRLHRARTLDGDLTGDRLATALASPAARTAARRKQRGPGHGPGPPHNH